MHRIIHKKRLNDDITLLPNPGVSKLGFIDTNSVIELVSKELNINNYTILGGISDVIPIGNEFNDKSQYYRETKGGLNTNLNYLLNCSIYQEEINDTYVVDQSVDCYINNQGLYNTQLSGVSNVIYSKTLNNSLFNTETVFLQNDETNKNSPIYISTKGGSEFKNNLIYKTTTGTSYDIIIKYYFNSIGVSRYYDLNLFNKAQNKYLTVVITKNNFFQELNNQTLYLGTSSPNTGAYQFTNGISTLIYKNF